MMAMTTMAMVFASPADLKMLADDVLVAVVVVVLPVEPMAVETWPTLVADWLVLDI